MVAKPISRSPYLQATISDAPYVLDLSIGVRQVWDDKGAVDEEQAYDLADTFYAVLGKIDEELDQKEREEEEEFAAAAAAAAAVAAAAKAKAEQRGGRGKESAGVVAAGEEGAGEQRPKLRRGLPPPALFVTCDLAQGTTALAGLGLLQKRLREERQQVG